jgi:hypothetical protein
MDWIQVLSLYTLAMIGLSSIWKHFYLGMIFHLIQWSSFFPNVQNWLVNRYLNETLHPIHQQFANLKAEVINQIDQITDEALKIKTKAWLDKMDQLLNQKNVKLERLQKNLKEITDEFYELMKNYHH